MHLKFQAVSFGQELAGFCGQIQQDGARLKQSDGFAVRPIRVHQRGDLVVRANCQKVRLELVTRAYVDRYCLPIATVAKAALLQHDVNLVPVRCGP